ncbi:FAD-dependent oxidoreductase [Thalassovita taeanensis]|uniref:FAD-dependent oxidoreductase n=1 Tax=Thalassovita taeanensis TaxID=657014 RepID=UPI000B7D691E|nr:FAD-dependent oxidoreductase [Thalassovita taeanensis]
MTTTYDVAIIGGGIAGASFACRIAERARAVLFEEEPHAGYHSTGRSAAEFTRQYHDD